VYWIAPERNILDCTNDTVCICVSALHELSNLYKCEVGACRVCWFAQFEHSWDIRTKNGGSKRCSKMRHPWGTQRMALTIEIIFEAWLDLHRKMENMFNAPIWLSRKNLAAVEWPIDAQHAPHRILEACFLSPPGQVVQPTHWTIWFCNIASISLCNPYKFG
jgi:hypothetical protein